MCPACDKYEELVAIVNAALDVERVLTTVGAGDAMVVCTLKDSVKLASIWPATARALWYVLQALEIESGEQALAEMISQLAPRIDHKN